MIKKQVDMRDLTVEQLKNLILDSLIENFPPDVYRQSSEKLQYFFNGLLVEQRGYTIFIKSTSGSMSNYAEISNRYLLSLIYEDIEKGNLKPKMISIKVSVLKKIKSKHRNEK